MLFLQGDKFVPSIAALPLLFDISLFGFILVLCCIVGIVTVTVPLVAGRLKSKIKSSPFAAAADFFQTALVLLLLPLLFILLFIAPLSEIFANLAPTDRVDILSPLSLVLLVISAMRVVVSYYPFGRFRTWRGRFDAWSHNYSLPGTFRYVIVIIIVVFAKSISYERTSILGVGFPGFYFIIAAIALIAALLAMNHWLAGLPADALRRPRTGEESERLKKSLMSGLAVFIVSGAGLAVAFDIGMKAEALPILFGYFLAYITLAFDRHLTVLKVDGKSPGTVDGG